MTSTTNAVNSRHLVDPDLAALVDNFPAFAFTPDSLLPIRKGLSEMMANRPQVADSFTGITRVERSIPGETGDPDVEIITYQPAEATTGALIWIHGGGFVISSASDDDAICRRIAGLTGATVISVDYRLSPETTAPGPLNDCYAALRWTHENSEELGIDPESIAVGGASAGAGLAASLAILARDRAEHAVGFQLLIYPMLDDRTASTVEPHPYAGQFVWTRADNRFGWSALLGHEPGLADVSPYSAAARVESTVGLAPAFISVGALDLFAEENIAYATRLLRAGVPTELHVYPGAFHGYSAAADARVSTQSLNDYTTALMRHFEKV